MILCSYGEIDIANILKTYIEINDQNNFEEYFNLHNEFILDNGKLIINSISFSYYNGMIDHLSIEGYLLV